MDSHYLCKRFTFDFFFLGLKQEHDCTNTVTKTIEEGRRKTCSRDWIFKGQNFIWQMGKEQTIIVGSVQTAKEDQLKLHYPAQSSGKPAI